MRFLLLSKMTLKLGSIHPHFQPIQIPILSYSYYLNQGYKRHKHNSDLEHALKCYDTAIYLSPYKSEAYYNRAILMIALNKQKQASKDIRAAISSQYLKLALSSSKNQCKFFLIESIKFSNNNILAKQVLNSINFGEEQYNIKNYWVMQDSTEGIQRQQCAIYPYQNFRLNGQTSSSAQELNILLNLYEKLTRQKNYQKQQKIIQSPYLQIHSQYKCQYNRTNMRICSKTIDFEIIDHKKRQDSIDRSNLLSVPKNLPIVNQFNTISIESSKYRSIQVLSESMYTVNSFSLAHKNCHAGCIKCQKKHINSQFLDPREKCFKLEIKTVEIYRSCAITNPKPYLIFNQTDQNEQFNSQKEFVTEVDYSGGFFPKWGSLSFYANICSNNISKQSNKQNFLQFGNKCKLQLWHKEIKGDILIGSIILKPKKGRYKCPLTLYCPRQMRKKNTAYIYLEIRKQ